MPYTVNTAPDGISKLPAKAKRIWIASITFTSGEAIAYKKGN